MADAWLYRSEGPDPDSTWNHAAWQLGFATERLDCKPTGETAASTQVVLDLCSKLLGAIFWVNHASRCFSATGVHEYNRHDFESLFMNMHTSHSLHRSYNCWGVGKLVVVVEL